jgi:hypothetical protein
MLLKQEIIAHPLQPQPHPSARHHPVNRRERIRDMDPDQPMQEADGCASFIYELCF